MNNADTPAMPLPVPNMFDGMSKDQIKYALALLCGLTKREHFAAMAMQGLLSNDFDGTHEIFTAHAVKIADALLKALEGDQ